MMSPLEMAKHVEEKHGFSLFAGMLQVGDVYFHEHIHSPDTTFSPDHTHDSLEVDWEALNRP